MRPSLPLALLLALLLLGPVACDSNSDDEGRFNVLIQFSGAGGAEGELRGRALFSTGGDDAEGFRIELVPRSERSHFQEGLVLARAEGARPGTGRYELALPMDNALPSGRFAGALQISFDGSAPALYYAESGTLVIDAFTDGRLEGRLKNVTATRVEAGGAGNAPLSVLIPRGQFSAESSDHTRPFPL